MTKLIIHGKDPEHVMPRLLEELQEALLALKRLIEDLERGFGGQGNPFDPDFSRLVVALIILFAAISIAAGLQQTLLQLIRP